MTRSLPLPRRARSFSSVLFIAALPVLVLACGSSIPAHEHDAPLSVTEHEQEAKAHENQAEVDREKVESSLEGEEVQCIDVGGPLNSGGESMPVMQPCWTKTQQNAAYLREAARQRKAAQEHREWAALLVEAEAEACTPLAQVDRDISPFMRYEDIVAVEQYIEGGKMKGAVVHFRKVPGLTADWFRASIRCHQARAAKLGYDRSFMPHCPLVLDQVGTSVDDAGGMIVVTLRSSDPKVAAEIYGRALRQKSEADGDEPGHE